MLCTQLKNYKNCEQIRYTREILEPVPPWHGGGAQNRGIWVFPLNKVIEVHQVCMSPTSAAV